MGQNLRRILSAVQLPVMEIYIINRTTNVRELTRSYQVQVDWAKHNHISSSTSIIISSTIRLASNHITSLPSLPIKRKIFHFYGFFLNLPPSRFILKFFRFLLTLLVIANSIHRQGSVVIYYQFRYFSAVW